MAKKAKKHVHRNTVYCLKAEASLKAVNRPHVRSSPLI
jgi:hypothetical protein